jgi:hypothetical protein
MRRLSLAVGFLLGLIGQVLAQGVPAGPATPVTISIASPAVVTWGWGNHNALPGEQVVLYSTGALPTGLVNLGTYYVISDASFTLTQFHIASTPNGAAINTTGSQSGTSYAVLLPPSAPAISNPQSTLTIPTRSNIASASNAVTAASPCVFTWTSTPAINGQTVELTGTTLPGTGQFNYGTPYYVVAQATNSVELAATLGGAALNCPTNAGVGIVTTLSYVLGDIIASSNANGGIVVPSFQIPWPGGGRIPYLTLQTSATAGWVGGVVSVDLWSAAPTYTNGDLSSYFPATGSASYLGSYTGQFFQMGDGATAQLFPTMPVPTDVKLSSGTVFWDIQMLGPVLGIPPISGQTFTLTPAVRNW